MGEKLRYVNIGSRRVHMSVRFIRNLIQIQYTTHLYLKTVLDRLFLINRCVHNFNIKFKEIRNKNDVLVRKTIFYYQKHCQSPKLVDLMTTRRI